MRAFLKQTDEPLFPDVLWNQPVNKRAAGSLLIIGGHASQFKVTQSSYVSALDSGIGAAKVILPKSVRKLTGALPDVEFLPSTPSGSLAREGLGDILAMAGECDGVLFSGELSNNSETVGLVEQLLNELKLPVILTDEIIAALIHVPDMLFTDNRLFIATGPVISDLAHTLNIPIYVRRDDLLKKVKLLTELTEDQPFPYVLHGPEIIIRAGGRTSVTPVKTTDPGRLYGACATWWLQQTKDFEALTTAAYTLISE